MGFDKSKSVNAAEKYLAQGKIAQAVQEYCKIVEHEPNDFASLNTLGDLYSRLSRAQEAVGCFLRVADHYREQGFSLKAIAMYKKILRHAPGVAGVARHLAALYEQQGLYVEAREQYTAIADAAARAGQTRDALEALRRIADFDPKNVDIRIRLAEGCAAEGMNDEAADAYVEAGELLLARGETTKALDAYKEAHELLPGNHAVLQGLVAASSAQGAAEEVACILERAVEAAPADTELRAMLARTYIDAEDATAAERATEALVSADQSNFPLLFDVARLYLRRSYVNEAVRALARAVEPALTGKQEATLHEILSEALARDPEHIEALKLLLRIYTWQRDDERMHVTLERLAEAAQTHNLLDEERRALEHLVRLVPFDQSYHERLEALGGASGEEFGEPATAHDAAAGHDAPPASELYDFDPFASAARAPETAAPTVEFEWNSVAGADSSRPAAAPAHADPSASFADLNADLGVSPEASFADLSATSETSFADLNVAPEVSFAELNADAGASFADLNGEFADAPAGARASSDDASAAPPDPFGFAASQTSTGAREFEPQEIHVADAFGEVSFAASAGDGDGRTAALLRQELESVDFYLEQGYADIARDTLDMLERQYGSGPEIDARRARLAGAPGAHAATDTHAAARGANGAGGNGSHAASGNGSNGSGRTPQANGSNGHGASHEESDGFLGNLVEFNLEPAPADGAVPAAAAEQAVAARGAEAAKPKKRARKDEAPRSHTASLDPGLAAIFDEFRESVEEDEEPESAGGDFETHYNLGLAYKEMDLMDEAVEQFQRAVDSVEPGDGTPRYLQCCHMLGYCFMQKGMARPAALWFKRGLELPDLTEDESQALRFELGLAYESMNDLDAALDVFSEVYGVDVSYRGVADKLRELESRRKAGVGG
jgi:tetratricopeptide (TPR) repeat protein